MTNNLHQLDGSCSFFSGCVHYTMLQHLFAYHIQHIITGFSGSSQFIFHNNGPERLLYRSPASLKDYLKSVHARVK